MSTNSTNSNNQFPNNFPTVSSGKLTTKIIIKSDYVRADGTCAIYLHLQINCTRTIRTNIIIKSDYVRADGTCAIYLQMFLNGKRKRINLDVYVPEEAFDKSKMRIKKAYKNSKDLNLIIEKVLADVNQIEIMNK